MTTRATAILYIDGFNLYRRCLEKFPELKWLDLVALAQNLLPDHEIVRVHYFTARVRPGASPDRQVSQRQDIYLRALRTLEPLLEIHFGHFRIDTRSMPAVPVEVDRETGQYRRVRVKKIEEKGSDVNLAVRMIADAHVPHADYFVMLTNDSDQVGTLRAVKQELGRKTGIIFPMESARGSKELMHTEPDLTGFVTREVLERSQLADVLDDLHGIVHRPPAWARNSEGPSFLGPSNR